MQKKSSKKPILILIVILLLAGGAYLYYTGTPRDNSALLTSIPTGTGDTPLEASQVLLLLNEISAINIDPSIFSSQVYKSLVDHTVVVLPQSIGRPNPFSPASGGN